MPMIMQCPFYKRDNYLKLYCEGATMRFPDAKARSEFVLNFCANNINWKKCPIAHCLENYYDRKGE